MVLPQIVVQGCSTGAGPELRESDQASSVSGKAVGAGAGPQPVQGRVATMKSRRKENRVRPSASGG